MTATAEKPKLAPTIPRQSRMTIASIHDAKTANPYRLIIQGTDGVGKSTFGASAPTPIFLGTEDGIDHLNVKRFPTPETWTDILEAIQTLHQDQHGFETLVFDSLDWGEPLVWAHVCMKHGTTNIEDVGGGYGRGYQAALDEWRGFLGALERLQRDRKMHIILIAHSFIKAFKNPIGEDFDRYVLKLNEKSAGLLREWAKGVYFANYETFAVKDKAKRVRGVSTGARVLYTQRTAAYDAKDKYGLPEQIPLSWEEFDQAARRHTPVDSKTLRDEVIRKAKELGGEIEAKTTEWLKAHGEHPDSLAQMNNRLNVKLAEKAETSTPAAPATQTAAPSAEKAS